jgi:hypothetical protein
VLGTLRVATGMTVGLVLPLSACSSTSEPDAPPPSVPASLDYHGPATDNDDAEAGTESAAPLTWRRADQRAAVAAGVQVMRAFASPTVSRVDEPEAQKNWWTQLRPLLSDQAASDYAAVDHANVPVHQVTGAGRLAAAEARALAIVHVPTDVGLYAVTLSRSAEDPRWLAERITPPEIDPHGDGEEIHSSGDKAGGSGQ